MRIRQISTTPTGTTYLVLEAETKERRPAFDHARLATALTAALKRPVIEQNARFRLHR